ncbi:heme oxygenase-like, multi-helical [Beauveria brongniartii RCEF 3172]|uniref:Heme oxygenase-like, multi-helical n=1 Tax=Beauveria brongniartii RCEF 3172 TaxID=1081107 RepID=A0A166WZ05_9HYPO|nr:heme oxygenase-like, multi-helical [Beauveria brongniartii RCEF 3172]
MPSFTQALIASDPAGHQRATQSPFLQRAATGTLSKTLLGRWLANDRLYIHGYIRAAGRLLSFLGLPEAVSHDNDNDDAASALLAWVVDALVNIQRESRFFLSTAAQYGLDVNLPIDPTTGRVPAAAKLDGLRRFEALFDGLQSSTDKGPLPWLEAAVVFYATERCYLDAWTWAASQMDGSKDGVEEDEDGGAVRRAFIDNWTSAEFVAFVERLAAVIDGAVRAQGEDAQEALRRRGMVMWRAVLEAETAFWPAVDGSL